MSDAIDLTGRDFLQEFGYRDRPVERPEQVPPIPNAADPHEQRTRHQLRQLADRTQKGWLHEALRHDQGRAFLWDIIKTSGAFEDQWHADSLAQHRETVWAMRGVRDFGLKLYHAWMRLDPEGVAAMHRHHDPRFFEPKEVTDGR